MYLVIITIAILEIEKPLWYNVSEVSWQGDSTVNY